MDAVLIIRTDKEAILILDDMRREILRLLAKEALTAGNLAVTLGLSAPTVSHHLNSLKRSGFVEIVRAEPESHGIVQKFYQSKAQAYIVETEKLSAPVKRYFMPARIERTRGILAALTLNARDGYKPSSPAVEEATRELARHILEAAERRQGPCTETDPECVINEIYAEALRSLLKSKPEILPLTPHTS